MLNVRCFLLSSLLLFCANLAFAGLPQPMCIYYGEALDGFGWPYTTNAEVVLLHGTNEIASQTIAGSLTPGINFALNVHLDDGRTATSYSARALHSGDLVSIVVRDQDGEKTIMEEQAVPPVGKPGEMLLINATAAQDSDHDGLPDQWEEEMVYWSFGSLKSILDVNPQDDFDKDGQSNWDEYRAGTFAFLNYDLFFAEDTGLTPNGRFRMSFLSVPGKLYGARYVTSLGLKNWTPSPVAASNTADFQTTPVEGNGDWLSIYVSDDLNKAFFRPTVESFDSYLLSATSNVLFLSAYDDTANAPYPASQFQLGDNGGTNFEAWTKLEGTATSGSHYLGASLGDDAYSWALAGTYAVGRSLPGIAHHGRWRIRMMHNAANTGFSGFNLKSAGLAGFGATELIRVGMDPGQIGFDGRGIHVSLDGGVSYTQLDCGWADGRGDTLLYEISWDESGKFVLTVTNETENMTTSFSDKLSSSAVTMLGVAVFGGSPGDSVQFDNLAFQTDP